MAGTKNVEQGDVARLYKELGGNVSAIARQLNVERHTVRYHIRKLGGIHKPLAAGSREGIREGKFLLPPKGLVTRYILTSAQNNTYLNRQVWEAIVALAKYYDARILVGTFSYNTNAYGVLAVKEGTKQERQVEVWFEPELLPLIYDHRVELAPGLVWCGEMNILPTDTDPFSGLETYSHRKSSIFPHVKMGMRSIETMQSEPAKFSYTTGTVTLKNYIQKKAGLKAEHHHVYGGLLVEVDSEGHWWVRQLGAHTDGRIQDLDVCVEKGKVTTSNRIEAVTWGDIHATWVEKDVVRQSMDMIDKLRPRFQFLHDVMEGVSINRHQVKNKCPHRAFDRWLRGFHRVDAELAETAKVIDKYARPFSEIIVPDSNHDGWWLKSWLAKYDYRLDPANAELFLRLQTFFYREMRAGKMPRDVNVMDFALRDAGLKTAVRFLLPDESFTICNKKIECGMHGHLGTGGSQGTPRQLSKIGRRANTAHTHSAGIYNGLYVAGTSSKLKWDYAYGPSAWSHSHVVTYPSGSRAIVTMYAGKWRA